MERDGLVRYVTGEVTLQLSECDGLGHRRHFVGHSELIGARRPRSLTSLTGHAALIGAWRPRFLFLERDWLARAANTL